MNTLGDDLLKGAKGAAAFTGLPVSQIYRLTEEGRIPCIRMGFTLYYRKSELDAAFRSAASNG
jgi:excisionase family DNA binding protein